MSGSFRWFTSPTAHRPPPRKSPTTGCPPTIGCPPTTATSTGNLLPSTDSLATETAALTDAFIVAMAAVTWTFWSRICSAFSPLMVDTSAAEVDSIVLNPSRWFALIEDIWPWIPEIEETNASIRLVCEAMRVRVALKAASRASTLAAAASGIWVWNR